MYYLIQKNFSYESKIGGIVYGMVTNNSYIDIIYANRGAMGKYLYNVSTGNKMFGDKFFDIIDNFIYKICGINKEEEMNWKAIRDFYYSSKCYYGIYRVCYTQRQSLINFKSK